MNGCISTEKDLVVRISVSAVDLGSNKHLIFSHSSQMVQFKGTV